MATENLGKTIPLPAAADLSTKQYYIVKLDSSGKVNVAGDGEDAVGILQNDPNAANREATVMVGTGRSKVVAGALTTAGGLFAADASGKAVDAASGDFALGRFIEAAGADGDVVSVLWQPKGKIW